MSGIIGHMTYAILAAKAIEDRKLPVAPIIDRHFASYLAGSYLGCDVQTLPEAICLDTGQEVGYGTAPIQTSPLTGGPVKPWKLHFEGTDYSPHDVHRMFYGRAHLVFGWDKDHRDRTIAWGELPHYCAAVVEDAMELFGPPERKLAYLFGWMTHMAGDSLIKSFRPGVTLHLLDGKYTPRNRPIQDLISFHEVGRKELGLNWPALLADLVDTPVEPIQLHYMRVSGSRGRLAWDFPYDWIPDHAALLRKVLAENRRYQRIRNGRLLARLQLKQVGGVPECDDELSRRTGGLSYVEMVEAARDANFRHALWQIAQAIADLVEQVVRFVPRFFPFPFSPHYTSPSPLVD